MSNVELSLLFYLQLAVILAVIRVVGIAAKWIGQPQVVGEMIAGVLMGPSLLGLFFPDLQAHLFPAESKSLIYTVSQVGVVIYMFLVGIEFNTDVIQRRLRSAASVSITGIIVPFTLGCLLALLFMNDATFFAPEVAGWEGMLFIAASMSITAFPMLARIIYERGLAGTSLGTLALAAGAIDDAAAWCILAIVLASFSGNTTIAILAIAGGAIYTVVVLWGGKRLLARLGARAERRQVLSGPMLSFVLMLLMLAAWYTDFVGIHAVFGGFILGLAMPRGVVTRELQRSLEPVITNFLLPLFFVYSGLNTQLNLVISPSLLGVTLLIVFVACFGKGVACWLAARLNGESNREAIAIGTLMNARGMMELILLNIGLQRGIITPTLFTILVIMAITTTLMTSPIFGLIYRQWLQHQLPTSPLAVAVPQSPTLE
ncbi:MAG: cation:proton antiporter [Caldilineaceae bacterium]|nr:cation:proton antiporter [Caldilineaceae bacterium]